MTDAEGKPKKLALSEPSVAQTALSMATASGTAAISVAALHASPWAMAVAAAGPLAKAGIEVFYYEHQKHKSDYLAQATADVLGTDPAGLGQAMLEAGEAAVPLTIAVFEAALRSRTNQTIDGLARVWAHGLGDDAKPDEDIYMVRTLDRLEAPDLQVLNVLPLAYLGQEGILKADVDSQLPHLRLIMPVSLGNLVTLGLVSTDAGTYGGIFRYVLTNWGDRAIRYLAAKDV